MDLTDMFKSKPLTANDSVSEYQHQYRMLKTVTAELIILGFLMIYVYLIYQIWPVVLFLAFANTLNFGILFLLHHSKQSRLCGHLMTINLIIITMTGNLLMSGVSNSYLVWFNVIPILSAVVIGWAGLITYSSITLGIIALMFFYKVAPYYWIPSTDVIKLDFMNYVFSLLITSTLLYSLLKGNADYQKSLFEQNYLLKADKEKFHYLARYDHLTNLPNRSYFLTMLEEMISNTTSENHLTIFFMDLDRFKHINDQYGHETGDELLRQTGKRLQACFREEDFIARLGGDEFTSIIKHEANDKIPKAIAQRILQEFNKPFVINNMSLECKISIGLATYPLHGQTDEELLSKADIAMYEVKKSGGNDCYIAEQASHETPHSPIPSN